jgi:hypothetical protein
MNARETSEIASRLRPYPFERALFLVGEQNAGKSVQLRSMFRDFRLGREGIVPEKVNLSEMYRLSNERILYLRLSSPHEKGETIDDNEHENYLDKTVRKFAKESSYARRWNFAGALQPNAARNMPDVAATVEAFVARLEPERVRVVFLSPDRTGALLQQHHLKLAARLRKIDSVEVCWIDARDREANGLYLADFFDFS